MDPVKLNILVVDSSEDFASKLDVFLREGIQVGELERAVTLDEAKGLIENKLFAFCFLSDRYNRKELSDFFSFTQEIVHARDAFYVQVKDNVPTDKERIDIQAIGFASAISRKRVPEDLEAINNILPFAQNIYLETLAEMEKSVSANIEIVTTERDIGYSGASKRVKERMAKKKKKS